jgi:hypothetical protein
MLRFLTVRQQAAPLPARDVIFVPLLFRVPSCPFAVNPWDLYRTLAIAKSPILLNG